MDSSFSEFITAISGSSENFFRDFVEEMPGGFFAYRADKSEEILYLNHATLRIFGCETVEEFASLTGNTFRGMVHPDDLEGVEQSIERQITDGGDNMDYVEYRIRHKDGSARRVADYGRYTKTDAFGGIFYVFIADDTDRIKRRMERLEKANETLLKLSSREGQYRKAILHDALFFYEVSLTGDRFINAVTRTRETEIYPISAIFNINISIDGTCYMDFVRRASNLIGSDDTAEYADFFDRERLIKCCEGGELEQRCEMRITDNLGTARIMQYVVLLGKSASDKEISALIMVRDITEQSERLSRLRSSLEQTRADSRAKSAFLANMSHDIKTPLNAILGFVDLIRLHLNDKDKTLEYLEKIRASGNQLLTTAGMALEITRMESGETALAETEGDLADMLGEIEKAMLPVMAAKEHTFKVDKTLLRHSAVLADFNGIKEILTQLLDNAAKFTDRGGKVTLRVDEGCSADGSGKYAFTVEDSGRGISDEFTERLFEPFAREDSAAESGIPGSGLGMTVVKRLVDIMSGEISVNSRPGKGSRITVTVTLRQTEKEAETAPVKKNKPISLKGKRILLVEDNEINSEIAEALLAKEGFLVESVPDGVAAVETLRESGNGYFDLVLMDIQMPRMNGYDATRAIRAFDTAQSDIPIIALSANDYAEDRKKSIEAGMDAHASIPLDMPRLLAMITSVLEERATD
ncbi:MAG: response regulator [Oscillospiraceae bacterium]|nr:response regulator [Oscillospiraceae bacterium]